MEAQDQTTEQTNQPQQEPEAPRQSRAQRRASPVPAAPARAPAEPFMGDTAPEPDSDPPVSDQPLPINIIEPPVAGEQVLYEDAETKVVSSAGHIRMIKKNKVEEQPYVPPPMTERMLSQRELELEAGRRRVTAHAEMEAKRPIPVISEAEKRAQGSSVPVFRPGNFPEYAPIMAPAVNKQKS